MLVARRGRTRTQSSRRAPRQRRRVYIGGAVTRRASASFLLRLTSQQVAARSRLADWLGAVAMLGGMVSWSVLLALLGS